MKQVLQNMRDGKTVVTEVPVPAPRPGQALVEVAASLVSAGTERMLVEFGEKSLVGKARSRPDLVRQVVDKMKREGVLPSVRAAFSPPNPPPNPPLSDDQPPHLVADRASRRPALGPALGTARAPPPSRRGPRHGRRQQR